MLKTLDRYQKCSYGTLEVNRSIKDKEVTNATNFVDVTFSKDERMYDFYHNITYYM